MSNVETDLGDKSFYMPQKHEIYGGSYRFWTVFEEKCKKYILQEMKNGFSLRQQQLQVI